jgi:arginyl-tRNA synthetase
MNPFAIFTNHVREAVAALARDGALAAMPDTARVVVEPPREEGHGDLATNAAMVLAKETGKKPRDLAVVIAAKLADLPDVDHAEVAGPGFINITLDPSFWRRVLRAALNAGSEIGRVDLGHREKVNVEYVSANPTGPLTVAHGRGAVFGDALARLLAFVGYDVAREYYVNDAGAQVDALARSAYLRYLEALGEEIGTIPPGLYPGDYLKPIGEALARERGDTLRGMPESEWLPIVRGKAIEMMMDHVREDLRTVNIHHDVFFSERSLSKGPVDQVEATIAALRAAGHVYEGRLPPPKGGAADDWEDREQTLFRSTAFGDDVDRPLRKSDGSYTYFASDIAYHRSKFERGFRHLIDVWGADHGGYIRRMEAAVKAISGGAADLDVKIVQIVRLFRAGEPVKMSKRAGDFVTLREVVKEVGPDPVRFMMLFRKNDAVLDFDLVKVIEQSRENPVFYVQYAHARGCSVFRNAAEAIPGLAAAAAELARAKLERLTDAGEFGLIKRIGAWPRVLEAAAQAHEPHRIAFYLHELASEFHSHWNRGKDLPHLRFIIGDDPEITLARLALVQGVVAVLASGLGILGVRAPEEMR